MLMNYDTFRQLVPTETLKAVRAVLLYLEYTKRITSSANYSYKDTYKRNFFLFLHSLDKTEEYRTLFRMYGYDDSKFDVDIYGVPSTPNFSDLFAKYASLFLLYDNEMDYTSMTPLDILIPIAKKYNYDCPNYDHYNYVFSGDRSMSEFIDGLTKYNDKKKKTEYENLEKKELDGFSPNVKSFLLTASSIRRDLVTNYKGSAYFNDPEKDSVPLSLLLAVKDYLDVDVDEDGFTKKEIINKVLKKNGLFASGYDYAIEYSKRDCQQDAHVIKSFYRKYFEKGIYEGKSKEEVTVQGIIENVLNHELNDTLVIDRVLKARQCNPESLQDFEGQVSEMLAQLKQTKEADYTNSLFKGLRGDTKEYLEFATKAYSLILEKMKDNQHNNFVLDKEDDVDTLALFIASYYFDLDVARFYESYGITLEDIFKFLKLDITKEEIENRPLSKKLLVDKFDRFARTGVNSNVELIKVTPTDLNHNLCNREFNRSTIMEDIFYGVTDSQEIRTDFLSQLKETLDKKDRERRLNECNELFKDVDVYTKRYLQKLVLVYKNMSKNYSKLDDVKSLSVLLTLNGFEDNELICETLKKNGLDLSSLMSKLGITEYSTVNAINANDKNGFSSEDIDIDLLKNVFSDLMYDEEGNKRSLKDIIKYIPEYCDSVTMKEIFAELNITGDTFTNIDELIVKTQKAALEEEKEKKARERFDISYEGRDILKGAIGILEYLKTLGTDPVKNYDLPELSILLSFLNSSHKKYFESNGLTLERVCKVLNIDLEAMLSSLPKNVTYLPHIDEFKEYIKKRDGKYPSFTEFKRMYFEDNGVVDYVISNINEKYGEPLINYDVLRTEVINNAPYMDSLPIDDRIVLLDNHRIESVDINAMDSVLSFGTSLSVHSKYIYDELPKLSQSDKYESSIETINSIVARVYNKREKRGLRRLFSTKDDKVEIDVEALSELRSTIDDSIVVLSEELKGYDSIRQYLEAYRRKNREYLGISSEKVDEIARELEKLNPEDDEQFDRFVYLKGLLQIMKDKVNRFNTTNVIARQDLYRITQAIVNHFITINALEMAKNDLFPLIGGELAISKGRESEKYSLELSKNVMDLFQALLIGNVASTEENLKLIKDSQIPAELVEAIDQDVGGYIESVKGLKKTLPAQPPILNLQTKRSEE